MNSIKQSIDILRFILISFETLILLIIIISSDHFALYFIIIGAKIKSKNEIWKLLTSIPFAYLAASIGYAWKNLIPLKNNKLLYQWPGYWRLKYRVITSIIICGIAASSSIFIWIFLNNLSEYCIGIIFIASITVPVASLWSQLLAAFKIREIIDSYS